jgi:hypothetical protein
MRRLTMTEPKDKPAMAYTVNGNRVVSTLGEAQAIANDIHARSGAIVSIEQTRKLYVFRDWASENNGAWRLIWAAPGADSFVGAYGACSDKLFGRMRDAIAHGERAFGERATKWTFGAEFK